MNKYEASLAMQKAVHPDGDDAKTADIAATLYCIGNVLSALGQPQAAMHKYEARVARVDTTRFTNSTVRREVRESATTVPHPRSAGLACRAGTGRADSMIMIMARPSAPTATSECRRGRSTEPSATCTRLARGADAA